MLFRSLSISPALKPDRLLIGRARMEASEFQNASLQCDRDRVGAIAGVELRQDAVDVRFDGERSFMPDRLNLTRMR